MDDDFASPGGRLYAVRIERVPKFGVLTVTFLDQYAGLYHHRESKRTPPCFGDNCPRGRHDLPRIFYAYAAVEVWEGSDRGWIQAILQISSNMEECLRDRVLRGETWSFKRSVQGDRNSAVVAWRVETANPDSIGEPFELLPILKRFFCCGDELQLGATNDTPARRVAMPNMRQGPPIVASTRPEEKITPPGESTLEKLRKAAGRPEKNGSSPPRIA
jgi:hypothetical protein